MATDVGTLIMKFKGDDKELHKTIDRNIKDVKEMGAAAETNSKKASKSFKGMSSSMKIGLTMAGAALLKFGKDSVKLYMEQEKAEARLSAIAKNVTGASDEQIASLERLAGATQKLTTFGDEVVIAGQSQILSFGVTTKSAEKLTGSLANLMAAQYGMNATQEQAILSANMFGKALNGQAGALSRAGILLNDQQAELLKTGNETERVATLTEIMNQNYGGLAQELAGTTGGQLKQLRNKLGDIGEMFGKVLIPAVLGFINVIEKLAGPVERAFKYIDKIVGKSADTFIEAQQKEITAMQSTLREQQKIASKKVIAIQKEKDAFVAAELEKLNVQKTMISESISAENKRVSNLISNAQKGATARVKALRNSQDDYDELIEEQIEKDNEVLEATITRLDKELTAFEKTKNKEIGLLDAQYNKTIKLLDAEAQEKIKKLNSEITKIEDNIKQEKEAKKLAKQIEKEADLKLAVSQAKNREEKQKAEEKLSNFLAKLQEEKIANERASEIQALEDKITNIQTETEEKKNAIKEQFEVSKTKIEDEIKKKKTATKDAIIQYKLETEAITEELSNQKAALLLTQEQLSSQTLISQLKQLKKDHKKIIKNLQFINITTNAVDKIYQLLLNLTHAA